MAKDRHKRMAQTLGCLVASMTVVAILLNWVQPRPSRPAAPAAMDLIAHSIKQQWQFVRVDPAPQDGRIDPRETHFFVDREGSLSWTETWRTQSHLGQKGVVRIALQLSANTNQIPAAQWETTAWLLGILRDRCGISQRSIALHDTLAVPPLANQPVPQALSRASVGQANLLKHR